MGRVNDVLSSDPHGLFMTLALLVVEPSRQSRALGERGA